MAQEQKYILLDSLTAHYQVKQYTLDTSPYGTKNSIEVYNVFSKKYETDKGEDFILLFSVLPDIDSKTNWEKIDFNKIKDNLFPTKEIFRRIMHKALGFYLDKNRDISKTKLVKIIKGEYYVSKYCWIEDFYCINNPFSVPVATKSFIINTNQTITPIGVLRESFMKLFPLCDDFPFEITSDFSYAIPEFFENTKQIKRVFTLYPVSIEIKENSILELKFSVQNESNNQSLLTLILELNQLVADKRSVINISDEDLNNITLN